MAAETQPRRDVANAVCSVPVPGSRRDNTVMLGMGVRDWHRSPANRANRRLVFVFRKGKPVSRPW